MSMVINHQTMVLKKVVEKTKNLLYFSLRNVYVIDKIKCPVVALQDAETILFKTITDF